jgi:hypothetical protein
MLEWVENSYGERYLPAVNGDIFARVPSNTVFKQYLHKTFEDNHVLYVVIGTDSGLLPKYIAENYMASGCKFLFVDTPEIAAYLADDYPEPLPLDENTETKRKKTPATTPFIRVVAEGFELGDVGRSGLYDEYLLRRQVRIVKSLAAIEKNAHAYQSMYQEYERKLIALQMSNNASAARRFMNAMLNDVPDMIHPISMIKNYYENKTFVLLGGAPSLPLIFPWLREHRKEVVVLAASRIAGRLATENITPDYFLAVDPDPQMLDYSQALFQFHDKSVLITSNHLAPNVMGQWAGRNFYMRTRFNFKDIPDDERFNLPGSGPTVMNSAIMTAGYLGASRIILSGVDFCYDPSGYSHESSSLESQIGRYFRYGGYRVTTYSGLEAETDAPMLAASRGLADQVAWLKQVKPAIEIININKYATKVENIDLVDVDDLPVITDIVSETQRQDAWNKASLTIPEYKLLLKEKVFKVIDKHKKRLDKIRPLAQQGIHLVAKMTNENDPRFDSWLADVKKSRKSIEKTMGDDLFVLFDFAYFDYVKLVTPLSEGKQTLLEALDMMKAYFSAVEKSSQEMADFLQAVRTNSQWRLKECDCQLTRELVDYWLENNLPGRCYVWFERCGRPTLSESEQSLFDEAAQAFKALLSDKTPSFRNVYEDSHQQLTSLWSHAKAAIKDKDVTRIQDLADYIATVNDDEFYQLSQFLYANLASLRHDWTALDEHLSHIQHKRLVVPALQLKLDTALIRKDSLLMLETLEELAVYDAFHMYIFAMVCPLLGYEQLAGQAFIYYLRTRPHDKVALWDYWHWLEKHPDPRAIQDIYDFMVHYQVDDPVLEEKIKQLI